MSAFGGRDWHLILLTRMSPWSSSMSTSPSSLLETSTEQKPSPLTCRRKLQRSGKRMSSWSRASVSLPSERGDTSSVLAMARNHPLSSYAFVSRVGPCWLHHNAKEGRDCDVDCGAADYKSRSDTSGVYCTWNDESHNHRSIVAQRGYVDLFFSITC